ncbi:RICIN domain-containing protein [Actinomadura fulvescens]|uniref:Ricin B lectin domain-containing protein n=1 Tax=Actinomadura fulvescens TaxID=46160 RepID=A0ABN3QY78_9ACTN
MEVTEQASETTKLSALPDGQFQFETSPVPIRVKRNGTFHDADLTLQRTGAGIASRMSVNGVSFGAGGNDVLATMTRDGKSLTLTWTGAKLPAPVLDGDNATYVDAGGAGVDLVVRSTPTGWSHSVVVRTPEAAKAPGLAKIKFGIRASGVKLKELSGERLAAVDATGNELFAAPAPLMWEGTEPAGQRPIAKSAPEEVAAGPAPRATTKPMAVEVGSGSLALVPDRKLLTAADTKFPVVLDPSWQTWNGDREADNDGHGAWNSGWAYVDRTFPDAKYWKPDRLPTGREVEDGTDKRSFIRMDASKLHQWSGNVKVKVNDVAITFDTLHAWSCTPRDVRLFNTGHFDSSTTWNSRPGESVPSGSGWDNGWLSSASVRVGRPECGNDNGANDARFTGGNLVRMLQWVTDYKWDIFNLGLYPDKDYDDTHTWKVMDVDPRMVVKYSRVPLAPKDVHFKNGGTTKKPCVQGANRPWVGLSRDRTLHGSFTDYDGDSAGGAEGQLLRAEYEVAPLGKPAESWNRYDPPDGKFRKAAADGYLHGTLTMVKGDEAPTSPDGGTGFMWRVRGQDDTQLYGPWSAWCEFVIDGKRPNQPTVTSAEYPEGRTGGYDAEGRKYKPGTFTFGPGGSGDVVKFFYKFSDGRSGTLDKIAPGASATTPAWTPKRFGWQWLEVTGYDRAGNPSPVKKYEFGVEQPPRDAGWAMDETSGNIAHAVAGTGTANPNADMVFSSGTAMNQPGNLAKVPADRSVRLNGAQFGEVRPGTGPDGKPVPLVDTSKRFMFSTWAKLATTTGDQIVVSQAAADGSVFELGWIGNRWTFRHRKADGTEIGKVSRNLPQAADGTPWTSHWVSLMAGYDPIKSEIWLRTQAEGETKVCPVPAEPWNCTTKRVMPEELAAATTTWVPAAGTGSLLFGTTTTATGKGSYWNGWLDDSQLWPLAHPDESVLRAIYGESIQDQQFAGETLRLVNVNSGQCLDVVDASGASQANVQQWICNRGEAQNWQFTDAGDGYYTLTNPNSGKCLDVDATDGSGTADGRNVWQYDCNGNPGQLWKAEKKANGYWLKSKRSDKCLTVEGGSMGSAANVLQWSCGDPVLDEQLWNITDQKFHELDGVTYRLRNTSSNKCMNVLGGSTTDGADVIQWTCEGYPWEDWKFVHQGNGYYTLISVNTLSDPKTAKCLEVADGSTVAGANIRQGLCEPGAQHQSWKVTPIAGDGKDGYQLIAAHSGQVVEVKDASADDLGDVVQNVPREPVEAHQVWKLNCLPGSEWRCA